MACLVVEDSEAGIEATKQRSIVVSQVEVVPPRNAGEHSEIAAAIFTLQLPKRMSHENLVEKLGRSPGVQSIKAM